MIKDFGCGLQEEGLVNHTFPVLNCSEELSIDLMKFISIVLQLIGWQRIFGEGVDEINTEYLD